MKPFYIESDEEVTSVIDRLRSSEYDENIFVVPSGAILLQSVVNMRLLLQQAQQQGKSISIVTSDEHGQRLVEKVGIPVYPSLDDIEHVEIEAGQPEQHSAQQIGTTQYFNASAINNTHDAITKDELPSSKNMKLSGNVESREELLPQKTDAPMESVAPDEPVASVQQPVAQQTPMPSVKPDNKPITNARPPHNVVDLRASQRTLPRERPESSAEHSTSYGAPATSESYHHLDAHTEKEVQAFFGHKKQQLSHDKKYAQSSITPYAHVPEKMTAKHSQIKLISWIFGGIIALVAIGVGFFAFLPRVTVDLIPIFDQKESTVEIVADGAQSSVDYDHKRISLTAINAQAEETIVASATGTSSAGSFKARGTITVYNSFSKKSQPLVATTRFLTEDGKLFRLVKRIVVPGMHEVDGELVPGEIDAEVVADKAGEEFNIDPSTFSIPGFKGSPKYKKFYGKSKLPMIGGSSEGGTKKVVSEDDLANARKSAEEKVRTAVMEKLRQEATAQGKKLLDDAVDIVIDSSGTQVTAGVAAESFDYHATAAARALIFDESNVKIIIARDMQGDDIQEDTTKRFAQNMVVQYSPSLADFDKQTLAIRATGAVQLKQDIDTDAVRKKLTGVSSDEVNEILQSFSGIRSADIYYQPGFLDGRFPWWEKAITVNVKE